MEPLAGLQAQGAPARADTPHTTPHTYPCTHQAQLGSVLLTFGISSLGTFWKVFRGGGVGHQLHLGKMGLHFQHLTDSHRIPPGSSPPCPGPSGPRSWEPQDPAALEGSVCSGNSLEALLRLSWTQRTQSVTHPRTRGRQSLS